MKFNSRKPQYLKFIIIRPKHRKNLKDDQFLNTRIKLTTVFNNLAITGLMVNLFHVLTENCTFTSHYEFATQLFKEFKRT